LTAGTQQQLAVRGIVRAAAINAAAASDAVTSGIDGFAVARDMRRSGPMGVVANLSNI